MPLFRSVRTRTLLISVLIAVIAAVKAMTTVTVCLPAFGLGPVKAFRTQGEINLWQIQQELRSVQ